jgi:hypothetical protein
LPLSLYTSPLGSELKPACLSCSVVINKSSQPGFVPKSKLNGSNTRDHRLKALASSLLSVHEKVKYKSERGLWVLLACTFSAK